MEERAIFNSKMASSLSTLEGSEPNSLCPLFEPVPLRPRERPLLLCPYFQSNNQHAGRCADDNPHQLHLLPNRLRLEHHLLQRKKRNDNVSIHNWRCHLPDHARQELLLRPIVP